MTVSKVRQTAHIVETVTALQTVLNTHTHAISDVTNLQSALDGKSDVTHNHDTDYADIAHNHDTDYAALSHNHDSDYASASHNHDTDYAALNHTHTIADVTGLQTALDGKASSTHNHDADYSAINHNHDADYADINHNHDSVYAAINHNHDTAYQAVGSGVLSAGTYGSTSNQQKIDTITLDAEGHVTGIVTDNSTTLHTMHDDHGNERHLRDYEHFKFSDGSGIDVTLTTTNSGSSTDPHVLTIEHADTSSQASSTNSGATVVQSVGVDGFGHVTSLATQSISASLIGAAAANHNHDSDYAAANHNHDSDYAAATHNHDTDYAALSHTHTISNVTGLQAALDGKASSTHNHDGIYL
jgi:hypothetical protein